MYRRLVLFLCAFAASATILIPGTSNAQKCFDVGIQYLGRDFVADIGGINYYRWQYRATGETCIDTGMSHWVLGICEAYWPHLSELSTLSVDSSDPADGDSTWYANTVGFDPTTGISGIKWDHLSGNQLDSLAEHDDFSFISPGNENMVQIVWSSKGSDIVEYGSTIGPSCDPLPAEQTTWGGLKARFR